MATKNKPGRYDCYTNAHPDEPMFVLLGRDPVASVVVEFWRQLRFALGQELHDPQLEEAKVCSEAMAEWARKLGKGERLERAQDLAPALGGVKTVRGARGSGR